MRGQLLALDPADEAHRVREPERARQSFEREAEFLGVPPNERKRTSWKHSSVQAFEDADDLIRELRREKVGLSSDSSKTVLQRHIRAQEIDAEIWRLQREARGRFKASQTN